jgi:hypothetical protein
MSGRRITYGALLALTLCFLTSACSAQPDAPKGPGAAQSDGGRTGDPNKDQKSKKDRAKHNGKGAKSDRKGAGEGGKNSNSGSGSKGPGDNSSGGDGNGGSGNSGGSEGGPSAPDGGSSGGKHGGAHLARGASSRSDADSDAETHGDVPAYTEITRASVEGRGNSVRLTLTLAAFVPDAMPDGDTFFNVGFRFKGKGHEERYVSADADQNGWHPSVRGSDYPGSFSVSGATIVFELPWSAIGGPSRFKWYADDSWVHSGLVTTSYSFDEAPNYERASYP